jgi:hypothetical protein
MFRNSDRCQIFAIAVVTIAAATFGPIGLAEAQSSKQNVPRSIHRSAQSSRLMQGS